MELFFWIWCLVCSIPAIYLAWDKTYVMIPNKKYNCFILRLIFEGPYIFLLTGALSAIVNIFFNEFYPFESAICISSFFSAIITLIYFRKFIMKSEIAFEQSPEFFNYELYVYTPKINVSSEYLFKPIYDTTPYYEGHKEITVEFYELKGKSIAFTRSGELIVRKDVIEVLKETGLHGYFSIPVSNKNGICSDEYFILITNHIMQPYSEKTDMRAGMIMSKRFMFDGHIYYDRSLSKHSDFNRTSEYINPMSFFYGPQKYWIVSNAAVRVLIKELGQSKRYFQPVYLIDDSESIKKNPA